METKEKPEEIISEARKLGFAGQIEDLKTEEDGKYSVMSWKLQDKNTGKDIIFILKIDEKSGEVVERKWIEEGNGEKRVLRYENLEGVKKFEELLKSKRGNIN